MGKKEVDASVRKFRSGDFKFEEQPLPGMPIPRDTMIALIVCFGMLKFEGSLAKRSETRKLLYEKATAEYDRRYPGSESPSGTVT